MLSIVTITAGLIPLDCFPLKSKTLFLDDFYFSRDDQKSPENCQYLVPSLQHQMFGFISVPEKMCSLFFKTIKNNYRHLKLT